MPDEELMYQALLRRDSSFEGIFFAAIRTTSIFCRPTCHARKPRRENVEFFSSAKDALFAGYRPCRICRPMEPAASTPEPICRLLDEISLDPGARWKDSALREKGLQPEYLRRWFKKHHGMTFQAYLRALRIGRAFERIREGEKVLDVAFSQGYDSLSGFTEAFRKSVGKSPMKCDRERMICISRVPTPLGQMIAGAVDEGICLLEFSDRRMLETQIDRVQKLFNAKAVPGESPWFGILERELDLYFEGKLRQFTVPVTAPGTPFQQKVWRALAEIPYGSTSSYRQQALGIGSPAAVRAVGRANGDNRIAIIIPCHRVIGEDGKPVGYGGGIWRKEYLLALERRSAPAP
jgi:AraC family transcriptional regulator of adaptative response/methylated-DNA-[protein]-cysteine methyltransferase